MLAINISKAGWISSARIDKQVVQYRGEECVVIELSVSERSNFEMKQDNHEFVPPGKQNGRIKYARSELQVVVIEEIQTHWRYHTS